MIKDVARGVWEYFKLESYRPNHVLLTALKTLLTDGNFGSSVRIDTVTGQAYKFDNGVSRCCFHFKLAHSL